MAFFGLIGSNNRVSMASDSGDAEYNQSELLGAYKDLDYLECQNIYRYWSLGKRIVNALPSFAMSAPRVFDCKDVPSIVNDRLSKVSAELNIDGAVKRMAIYIRIYGLASIYLANDNLKPNEPLSYGNVQNHNFSINVLDPLSMLVGGQISVDNNPLSENFSKPIYQYLGGHKIHKSRIFTHYNDIPLFYKFNPSSFSFSGPSIYQNMTLIMRVWNRAIISFQRMATKASAIIKTTKEGGTLNGNALYAIEKNLEMIRNLENDGIASIKSGESLEFFNLSGIQEIDTIINTLNTCLMMALSDTPAGILLDKNLSVGLNDGTEDMKAILMAVENFRQLQLKPIYTFIDKYLCYKSFTYDFIKHVKSENMDIYADKSEIEILNEWLANYHYSFGDLYPQSENERADTLSKNIDNLTKIQQMGANIADVESALNSLDVYNTEFTLESANLSHFNDNEGLDIPNDVSNDFKANYDANNNLAKEN